jgi:CysZ protein
MLAALALAIGQTFGDPALRRIVWRSVGLTLLLLVVLLAGAAWALSAIDVSAWRWLDLAIGVLGWLAAVVLAWFLFPAVVGLVAGLFLDEVADAVERLHYRSLPPATSQGAWRSAITGLRFFGVLAAVNLAALVIAPAFPPASPLIFLVANAYLLGREYVELVIARRPAAIGQSGRTAVGTGRLIGWGLLPAILLLVPVVNLFVPILGTAAIVHLIHRRRM